MSLLQQMINEAEAEAENHASMCSKIIIEQGLKEALDYCKEQNIDPPQCSLEAQSPNADKMRVIAERMLCEIKWWKRRLRNKAAQVFEHEQLTQGNVKKIISNESFDYQIRRKRR